MMSATTRFHRNDARRQTAGKLHHAHSVHTPPNDNAPAIVQSHDAAAVLAQVDPKSRNLHHPPSYPPVAQPAYAVGKEGRAIP